MRLILLLFPLFFIACNVSVTSDENKKIIIPQYFYDYDLWQKVVDTDTDGYVIINPSNGPGDDTDSAYFNEIDDLVRNGKTPVGYVYTKWGERDIEEVKDDIDKWLGLYPQIKGFFIDEASTLSDRFEYYKELKEYIDSKGDYKFILNPGTVPDGIYFSIADTVVVYEGNATGIDDKVCGEYPSQSAVIVYGADENQMRDIVKKACRYFYITDDNDTNPYDSLPSYFDEEIMLLK